MAMLLNGRPYADNDALPRERIPVDTLQLVEISTMAAWAWAANGHDGRMMSMAHPIHLHGQQFQILSRSADDADRGLRDHERGFHLQRIEGHGPGDARRARQDHQAVRRFQGRVLHHCHNLEHEDMA